MEICADSYSGIFIATCVQTVITHFATRLPNMIGSNMGTLSITTTGTMWLMFIIFIVYEFCTVNDNPYEVHKYDCLILIGVFLIGTALIFASLYVQWTRVGKDLIDGTQGRYFTPLMAVLHFFVMFMRQIKLRQQGKCDRSSGVWNLLLYAAWMF